MGEAALGSSVLDPMISLEATPLSGVCDKQEWAVASTEFHCCLWILKYLKSLAL